MMCDKCKEQVITFKNKLICKCGERELTTSEREVISELNSY